MSTASAVTDSSFEQEDEQKIKQFVADVKKKKR
jgi:hypothetical protein